MLYYAERIFRRKMNMIIVKCILPILLILPVIYFTIIYFYDDVDLLRRKDQSLPSLDKNVTILTVSRKSYVNIFCVGVKYRIY